MAKDIAQVIAQTTNNKGVAGWSLKTDDNATVDPTINWQEGQMPSTVNNSARAMMTRIREEHDIVNDQLKAIKHNWGSNFLYVEVGSYTLKKDNDGTFNLNLAIKDKLTDEQYADLKAGKLQLAVNSSNDTLQDSVYQSLTTQDVISLSLSIPTASTAPIWDLYVRLSFFGRRFETNRVTLHELPYILNNFMEYVAEKADSPSNGLRTVKAIPLNRSYVDFKTVEVKDYDNDVIEVKVSWYYISPCEIILTVEPTGPNGRNDFNQFTYELGLDWGILTFLDAKAREAVGILLEDSPPFFIMWFPGGHITPPDKWDGGRYRFHAKLTTDAHFKLYPMNRYPGPGKTYPIIT